MDRAFFIAEIETCSDMMYRVAWSILRNEADVQDALQDAVREVFPHLDDPHTDQCVLRHTTNASENRSIGQDPCTKHVCPGS